MARTIKVLLADDHAVLREATAELLDHQPDMEVIGQVGTGEEALELVAALYPDFVVLDIAMPRMNGLEATRHIIANHPHTKVLVLSAHEDAEHVLPLLKVGVTGYLHKTTSLNDLLEAIRSTSQGISVLPSSVASVVVRYLSGGEEQPDAEKITERELAVLRLVAEGMTNDQIAHKLHLSKRTVEAHLTHIYNKLNVCSRTEAALLAQKRGWI